MTVKIVKMKNGQMPILMGADRLPPSYQAPAQEFVAKYGHLMARCKPYHFASLATCVREADASFDAQVDADLMDDFHAESKARKPTLNSILYRFDDEMIPV